MVERGGEVEQDECRPVDAERDDPPCVALQPGEGDEQRERRHCQHHTDAVRDAVRDFLAGSLCVLAVNRYAGDQSRLLSSGFSAESADP